MSINVPEDFRLGINTGFAVNRYSEPDDWLDIVGGELGLSIVQLTADMLNVDLPEHVISNQVSKMLKACDKNLSLIHISEPTRRS